MACLRLLKGGFSNLLARNLQVGGALSAALVNSLLVAAATTYALIVKKALVGLLKLPFRMITVLFSRLGDLHSCNTVDEGAISVPTFYAHRNEDQESFQIRITTVIVATLFGGVHCAGWNFPFPSHPELIIWRVSSLIIVIVPCTFVPLLVGELMEIATFPIMVNALLSLLGVVIYFLARLALFVEALTTLRHLPPGAYAAVKWTDLLLHM